MKNSYQNESSKKKQFYLSTVEKYELENYVSRNRYSKEIELHKLHFHTPAKVSLDGMKGKSYELSATGFETIRRTLQIPNGYVKKISPENVTANLNKRIQEIDPERKKKMVLVSQNRDINVIDGFVSTSFNYVDDKKLLGLFYALNQFFEGENLEARIQVIKATAFTMYKFIFSNSDMNLEVKKEIY